MTAENPQPASEPVKTESPVPATRTPPKKAGLMQAVRTAYIGAGQCGNNFAEEFFLAGVPETGMLNTAPQDMAALTCPNKLVIGKNNEGGAGKDLTVGKRVAQENREEIIRFFKKVIGPAERVWLEFGAGGGTGAGTFPVLVECADIAIRKDPQTTNPLVGAIIALPTTGESRAVKENARISLELALRLVDEGRISPLIVVNNAALQHAAPVTKFKKVVNSEVVKQVVRFNAIAAMKEGGIDNFDRADYLSVLESGVVNFGFARVKVPDNVHLMRDDSPDLVTIPTEDIEDAISKTLKADKRILDQVTAGAAMFVGCSKVLDRLNQGSLEDGFDSLNRQLPNAPLIHRGIYVDDTEPGLIVTALVAGKKGSEFFLDMLK